MLRAKAGVLKEAVSVEEEREEEEEGSELPTLTKERRGPGDGEVAEEGLTLRS
jgi:hypothetical protein